MIGCRQCGAGIAPNITNCPYCGAVTAYGEGLQQVALSHQHARGHMQLHAEWAREQQAQRVVRSSATQSLIWSLIGVVTCCFPVASIVGVVQGIRSWKLSVEKGMTKPAAGVAGLVIGLVGLATSGVGWAWFGYDTLQGELEEERLAKELAQSARAETLSQKTACALTKLEVLESHYQGYYNYHVFECHGRLEQQGERATLHDVKLKMSGESKTVFACLSRGADRWFVKEMRTDAQCWGEPVPSAVPDAAGAPDTDGAPGAAGAGG